MPLSHGRLLASVCRRMETRQPRCEYFLLEKTAKWSFFTSKYSLDRATE